MNQAIERHERELAASLGAEHAVTFAFARQALAAVLEAAELQAGDAVALSPLTCKVVPLALLSLELEPVWVDIARGTLNVDGTALEREVASSNARAVLFQHTYGSPGGLEAAERIARERDLFLLEDCAQCLPLAEAAPSAGADGPPRRAAVFSNNLMKPLPAGSGGVAVTGDEELAKGIRAARERLREPTAREALAGFFERMAYDLVLYPSTYWPLYALAQRFGSHYENRSAADEVRREVTEPPGRISPTQARAGSRWLERAAKLAAHKRATCAAYADALAGTAGLELPLISDRSPLTYFPVLVPNKAQLLERAKRKRVELVPWPLTTPIYPVEDEGELAKYGYELGSCPVAERVASELVGLPTHGRIGDRQRDAVVRLLLEHGVES